MRGLPIALLALFVVLTSTRAQAQDRASDLASPWRARGETGPREAADGVSSGEPPEVFGDGHAGDVGWADPELDLEPRERLSFVLAATGGWFGAGTQTADGAFVDLRLLVDVCLEPTLSLHVRAGVGSFVRLTAELPMAGAPEGGSRAALVGVRAIALVGVHIVELVAIRVGGEIGEGYTLFGGGALGALGGAFLSQAAVRFASGRMELGLEVAAALIEGGSYTSSTFESARGVSAWAPRVGAIVAGTF